MAVRLCGMRIVLDFLRPHVPCLQVRNVCRVLAKSMHHRPGLDGDGKYELRLKPDPGKWAVVATRDTRLDACPYCKQDNAFNCRCKKAKNGKISYTGPNWLRKFSVRQPKDGPSPASSRLFTCKRTRISTFFTAENFRTHVLEYRKRDGRQHIFGDGGALLWHDQHNQNQPTTAPLRSLGWYDDDEVETYEVKVLDRAPIYSGKVRMRACVLSGSARLERAMPSSPMPKFENDLLFVLYADPPHKSPQKCSLASQLPPLTSQPQMCPVCNPSP